MNPIEKAEFEVVNGRVWRARDILRANAGFAPYDVELYRKLGEVLLLMHDVPEARKYLFLSGSQDPAHTPLIAAFGNKFKLEIVFSTTFRNLRGFKGSRIIRKSWRGISGQLGLGTI